MIDFHFNMLKVLVLYMAKIKINRFDNPCLCEKKNKNKISHAQFSDFCFWTIWCNLGHIFHLFFYSPHILFFIKFDRTFNNQRFTGKEAQIKGLVV